MNKKEKIDQEVQKTLQCFDQKEKIESSPYFYSRILAALKDREVKKKSTIFGLSIGKILRPAFLVGIIVLNIVTAAIALKNVSYKTEGRAELITEFAEEYSFTQNNYDYLMTKK